MGKKRTKEETSEVLQRGFARTRAESTVRARCKEEAMSRE